MLDVVRLDSLKLYHQFVLALHEQPALATLLSLLWGLVLVLKAGGQPEKLSVFAVVKLSCVVHWRRTRKERERELEEQGRKMGELVAI